MRNLQRMVEAWTLELTDAPRMIASLVTSMRSRWAVAGGGEHNLLIHIDTSPLVNHGVRLIFELREDRHEKNLLELVGTILSFDRPATREKMVNEVRDLMLAGGYPVCNDIGLWYSQRVDSCWADELRRMDRRGRK